MDLDVDNNNCTILDEHSLGTLFNQGDCVLEIETQYDHYTVYIVSIGLRVVHVGYLVLMA
jgi:hypothetical protein